MLAVIILFLSSKIVINQNFNCTYKHVQEGEKQE
jgi:hypothetical protein